MSKLADKYAEQGLVVLAVNAWDESREMIEEFSREMELNQLILVNGGRAHKEIYKLKWVPHNFWIDRQGIVVSTELSFHGAESLERRTQKILAPAP